MADDGNGSSSDPYAAAKANLRDTVKWLATALAALAGAVLTGVSITGISGLHGCTLALALAGAGAALLCVFIAIGILLRLLSSESFYLAQLDELEFESIRKMLARHSDDILSPVFKDLDQFLELRKKAFGFLRCEIETPKDQLNRDRALKFVQDIADQTLKLVSLAHLEVLRSNLRRKEPWLLVLTIVAIVGIGTFAVLTGNAKSPGNDRAASSAFEFAPGANWAVLGQSLAASCGDKAPMKAEFLGAPQPGWIEVKLLSPERCAGMRFDIPEGRILRPSPR